MVRSLSLLPSATLKTEIYMPAGKAADCLEFLAMFLKCSNYRYCLSWSSEVPCGFADPSEFVAFHGLSLAQGIPLPPHFTVSFGLYPCGFPAYRS